MLWHVLLIWTRLSAFFFMAPLFSLTTDGGAMRNAGAALLLSLALVPTTAVQLSADLVSNIGLLCVQFAAGALLGLGMRWIFAGVAIAGTVLDNQSGIAMASQIDALSGTNAAPIGVWAEWLAMASLVAAGGMRLMVQSLIVSFRLVPLALPDHTPNLLALVGMAGGMFATGLSLALPVILVLLCGDFALGVLSNALPQLGVFVVGLPLKMILVMVCLALSLPLWLTAQQWLLQQMLAMPSALAAIW